MKIANIREGNADDLEDLRTEVVANAKRLESAGQRVAALLHSRMRDTPVDLDYSASIASELRKMVSGTEND